MRHYWFWHWTSSSFLLQIVYSSRYFNYLPIYIHDTAILMTNQFHLANFYTTSGFSVVMTTHISRNAQTSVGRKHFRWGMEIRNQYLTGVLSTAVKSSQPQSAARTIRRRQENKRISGKFGQPCGDCLYSAFERKLFGVCCLFSVILKWVSMLLLIFQYLNHAYEKINGYIKLKFFYWKKPFSYMEWNVQQIQEMQLNENIIIL